MRRTGVSLIGGCFFALLLLCGGSSGGAEPKVLRVCADPDNLPFSNDKLEGFENKIAELVTQDLGAQQPRAERTSRPHLSRPRHTVCHPSAPGKSLGRR